MPFTEGAQQLNTFSAEVSGVVATVAEWSMDGKSIIYSVNANNVSNLWSQPLDGGDQSRSPTSKIACSPGLPGRVTANNLLVPAAF